MNSESSRESVTGGTDSDESLVVSEARDGDVIGTSGDVLPSVVPRSQNEFVTGKVVSGSVLRAVVVGVAKSTSDDGTVFALCQFPGSDIEFPIAVSDSEISDIERYFLTRVAETTTANTGDGVRDKASEPCSYRVRDTDSDSRTRYEPIVYLPVFSLRVSDDTLHVVNGVFTTRREARSTLHAIRGSSVNVALQDVSCDVSVTLAQGRDDRVETSDGIQLHDDDSLQHYVTGVVVRDGGVRESVVEWIAKRRDEMEIVIAVIAVMIGVIGVLSEGDIEVWGGLLAVAFAVIFVADWFEKRSRAYGLLPEWVVETTAIDSFTVTELLHGDSSDATSERGEESGSDSVEGDEVRERVVGERRVESIPVTVLEGDGWVALEGIVDDGDITWRFEAVNTAVLPGVVRDVLQSVPVVDGESVVTVVELPGDDDGAGVSGDVIASECGDWGLIVS